MIFFSLTTDLEFVETYEMLSWYSCSCKLLFNGYQNTFHVNMAMRLVAEVAPSSSNSYFVVLCCVVLFYFILFYIYLFFSFGSLFSQTSNRANINYINAYGVKNYQNEHEMCD